VQVTSGTVSVRLLTGLLLAALGCVLGAGLAGLGHDAPAPRAGPTPAVPDRTAALSVLREWDAARAAAWRSGSPAALRGLYAEGSASGRADRVLLAAYRSRGLRVDGMSMQRSLVRVIARSEDRWVLRVTDRLVGAFAVGPGGRLPLPRDTWSTRVVVLLRMGERWRVAEVLDQARPAASTDVTSRSANS
jgi:hypothetical protein